MIRSFANAAAAAGLCSGIVALTSASGTAQSLPTQTAPASATPSMPASASLPPRTVRVAVFAEAPFAMQEASGRWSGYAVTFLDAAAADAQLVLEV